MSKVDDVAKLSNVSKGTVSNVFSGKRPTSDEVKKRVLEAARILKYTPNHIARSLVTKKTLIIGLKMPYGKNVSLGSLHTDILTGVVTEAAAKNYRVLIDTIPPGEQNRPYISTDPIDGVIVLGPERDDVRIKALCQSDIPFVVIGVPYGITEVSYVDNNNEEMLAAIVSLLAGKGRKKILFLNAVETKTVAMIRGEGFKKGLEENRLEFRETDMVYNRYLYEDSIIYGYNATMEAFRSGGGHDAIIADTDRVAAGVLKALKEMGKQAQKDIPVVALSDDYLLSRESDAPLTTVNLFPGLLGREAVKLLMEKMQQPDAYSDRRVIIPARIIER